MSGQKETLDSAYLEEANPEASSCPVDVRYVSQQTASNDLPPKKKSGDAGCHELPGDKSSTGGTAKSSMSGSYNKIHDDYFLYSRIRTRNEEYGQSAPRRPAGRNVFAKTDSRDTQDESRSYPNPVAIPTPSQNYPPLVGFYPRGFGCKSEVAAEIKCGLPMNDDGRTLAAVDPGCKSLGKLISFPLKKRSSLGRRLTRDIYNNQRNPGERDKSSPEALSDSGCHDHLRRKQTFFAGTVGAILENARTAFESYTARGGAGAANRHKLITTSDEVMRDRRRSLTRVPTGQLKDHSAMAVSPGWCRSDSYRHSASTEGSPAVAQPDRADTTNN